MRDTVDLNPAGVFLLEKLFSKQERAKIFRTWAGSASMLLKGGNAVWGEHVALDASGDDSSNVPDVVSLSPQVTKMALLTILPALICRQSICVSARHLRAQDA